jgi:hypothetical protein
MDYAVTTPIATSPASPPVMPSGVWPLHNHPAFDVPLQGDLAVIACHFNPAGYERPRRNMAVFLDWLWGQRVPVFMVELTYPGQPTVLPAQHERVLQVQTAPENVMWHKEGLLNLVPKIVPPQFRKLAWIDADVVIRQKEWYDHASALLNQVPVIQLFSRAIFTDERGREAGLKPSVGYAAANRDPRRNNWSYYHCGFAWAARRELWERYGGLYHSIIGHGDSMMALAAMNAISREHGHISPHNEHVFRTIQEWAGPFTEWTQGRLDCIPSDLVHLWHGSAKNRNYMGRYAYTADLNPRTDIAPNPITGVIEWTQHALTTKPHMVAACRDYFTERREDG